MKNTDKIGKSLIMAGLIIMLIGTIIYILHEEDQEVKNIKQLIKEADKIIQQNT
ncbi:MAG: hypothetical protein ABDH21_05340 [bacterium]